MLMAVVGAPDSNAKTLARIDESPYVDDTSMLIVKITSYDENVPDGHILLPVKMYDGDVISDYTIVSKVILLAESMFHQLFFIRFDPTQTLLDVVATDETSLGFVSIRQVNIGAMWQDYV